MIFPGPKPSHPKALKLAGVPPSSNTRAFLWLFFMALVCSGKFIRPGLSPNMISQRTIFTVHFSAGEQINTTETNFPYL
jgi:hypothetical protein